MEGRGEEGLGGGAEKLGGGVKVLVEVVDVEVTLVTAAAVVEGGVGLLCGEEPWASRGSPSSSVAGHLFSPCTEILMYMCI